MSARQNTAGSSHKPAVMWCFTADYELENEKMIGARLKLVVKDHITTGLWLEPTVFWRPLITAGLSQEPTVIVLYHCRF